MGKRKLCTSMIVGSIIGGLIALRHAEVRSYARRKLSDAKSTSNYLIKNPAETVRNARIAFDQFNQQFSSGAKSAVNALEQVEQTLEKVSGKSKQEPRLIE